MTKEYEEVWLLAYLAAIVAGKDRDDTCTRAYQAMDDWRELQNNLENRAWTGEDTWGDT